MIFIAVVSRIDAGHAQNVRRRCETGRLVGDEEFSPREHVVDVAGRESDERRPTERQPVLRLLA